LECLAHPFVFIVKAIGVSVKDRGVISMAGHAGTAYWFSKAGGEFITSNYYLDHYPQWVENWNRKQLPQRYADTNWDLLHDQDSYLFGTSDDSAKATTGSLLKEAKTIGNSRSIL
jgi:hypothetical protein